MIGIDVVDINRIQKLADDKGLLFVQKMLNTGETRIESLAGIFAAKEALAKALGTGLGLDLLKHATIVKDAAGKPYISYEGVRYDLSIAHDADVAVAVCNVERGMECDEKIMNLLPERDDYGNKGTFGRLAIVSGSSTMTGCAYLSSQAAMRCGTGYTFLYAPREIINVLQTKTTEVIVKSFESFATKTLDAVVIGPGLSDENGKLIKNIFEEISDASMPVLIDADGFKYIKENDSLKKKLKGRSVLTPHPGEAGYLINRSTAEIINDIKDACREISDKYGAVCVLKGHKTVVACEGEVVYTNNTGNHGMATAGSGDVLSGMIGAFLAQGMNTVDAAKVGVYCHGLSGDYMAMRYNKRALIAGDLIEGLKYIFKEY